MSKTTSRPSLSVLITIWLVALLSIFLLVPTGAAVGVEVSSFRSCSINSADLFVHTCGKQSLNFGDLLIAILFLGAVGVVASLFTHAWRLTRRPA